MQIFKSLGAIVIGFVLIAVLSVITDLILESVGIFSPADRPELFRSWMAAIALFYRALYAGLGGWVTAWLAPSQKMRHVWILAIIGTTMGTLGTIANWSKVPPGTEWYPLALIPASLIAVVVGGQMKRGV